MAAAIAVGGPSMPGSLTHTPPPGLWLQHRHPFTHTQHAPLRAQHAPIHTRSMHLYNTQHAPLHTRSMHHCSHSACTLRRENSLITHTHAVCTNHPYAISMHLYTHAAYTLTHTQHVPLHTQSMHLYKRNAPIHT